MAETINVHWDHLPDERRQEMAGRLHVHAAGLERIIEALLDHSRLEAGMVVPQRRLVPLAAIAIGVVDRLQTLTEGHDVRVVDRGVVGKREVWADPVLLERVLENLVTNACRHTPEGSTVRVELREQGGRAVVEVRDDGPGIDAQDLARLGERFYRPGAGSTRSTEGLGLGLAFCREVLAMHDTELHVVSEVGVGTSFSFSLAHEDSETHLIEL